MTPPPPRVRPSRHLAAKADPALVADDERHFAAIAQSLEQTIADLSERLEAARARTGRHRAGRPGPRPRGAPPHRTAAHPAALRPRPVPRPRRAAEPAEPVYVGRLGLTDADGERLLVDWRSPAAEPFFGATHADPMGLASRRRYRWTLGRVSDYWDEVFTSDGLVGHAAALDDQSAFIASLGSTRSGRMRDVLATIAADQDAIVRAGPNGALVVDGGPGTGKTVVALHRTAYLLYSDPRLGHRKGGVLVRRPAPALPRLRRRRAAQPRRGGGADLHAARPRAGGAARPGRADPEVARLKAGGDLVAAIEPAVAALRGATDRGHGGRRHRGARSGSAPPTGPTPSTPRRGAPHNESATRSGRRSSTSSSTSSRRRRLDERGVDATTDDDDGMRRAHRRGLVDARTPRRVRRGPRPTASWWRRSAGPGR